MKNTWFPVLLVKHTRAAVSQPYFHPHLLYSYQSFNMPSVKRGANSSDSPGSTKKQKANGSITSFFGAPKPKGGAGTPNASVPPPTSRFNKEKWVASLTAEQKELLQLEIDTLDESWLAHLKDEVVTPEFLNLKRFLKKEKDSKVTIFPPEKDIYSW
jgi:uracil-DNA glycosylase